MNKINANVLLPKIVWMLTYWITSTLRLKEIGFDAVINIKKRDERIIYALWHGRHLIDYHKLSPENINVLVSPSRDGRRIATLLRMSGFSIIHGSSNKSPVKALITSVKTIQEGGDFLITVDGPKGPPQISKPGVIYIAKKTQAWIVPTAFAAKKRILMRSWDRFLIPLPFTRAIHIFGTPYRLSPETDQEAIDQGCRDLDRRLNRLTDVADRALSQ